MADISIIREFVARLGFKVDNDSLNRAKIGLEAFEKGAGTLLAAITAATVAAGAAIDEAAHKLENLFFAAQQSGASAANIRALSKAFGIVGLNANDAVAAVESLFQSILQNPGKESLLASIIGPTRDAKGKLLDTTDLIIRLVEHLKKMPFFVAARIGEQFGISPQQLLMWEKNLDAIKQARAQVDKFQKESGVNFNDLTASSHKFLMELRDIEVAIETLAETFVGSIVQKLEPSVKRLDDYIKEHFADIVANANQVRDSIINMIGSLQTQGVLETALNTWTSLFHNLVGVVKSVDFSGLSNSLKELWQTLKDFGSTAGGFTSIWKAMAFAVQTQVDLMVAALKGVKDILIVIIDLIRGDWTKAWTDSFKGIKEVGNDLLKFLKDINQAINNIYNGLNDWVGGRFETLRKKLESLLPSWLGGRTTFPQSNSPSPLHSSSFYVQGEGNQRKFISAIEQWLAIANPLRDLLQGIGDAMQQQQLNKDKPPVTQISYITTADQNFPSFGSQDVAVPNNGQPLGVRNNNPGNLRAAANQVGSNRGFAVFNSVADGLAAMRDLLLKYAQQGRDTIASIISKYAPASENDTQGYIAAISRALGVAANEHLNLNNPEILSRLMQAIVRFEQGKQPYSTNQYSFATGSAPNASGQINLNQTNNTTINAGHQKESPEVLARTFDTHQRHNHSVLIQNLRSVVV